MEVLILTAARSGEILGATWSEFDLDKALWSIPTTRMKMGRPHSVPLASQVIDALARAKEFSAPCTDLLFPGMKLKTPMSDMTLRDMETGTTVHGFRSAFRDWVADITNYPGEVAEAALAHANANKVEAAYRRTGRRIAVGDESPGRLRLEDACGKLGPWRRLNINVHPRSAVGGLPDRFDSLGRGHQRPGAGTCGKLWTSTDQGSVTVLKWQAHTPIGGK